MFSISNPLQRLQMIVITKPTVPVKNTFNTNVKRVLITGNQQYKDDVMNNVT